MLGIVIYGALLAFGAVLVVGCVQLNPIALIITGCIVFKLAQD